MDAKRDSEKTVKQPLLGVHDAQEAAYSTPRPV